MNKKRSRLLSLFLLPLAALVIFGACFAASMIWSIPKRAQELYGPPDPNLSASRLFMQSFLLTWKAGELSTPTDREGGIIEFPIEPGDPPSTVIHRLKTLGLIDNPSLFRTYLIYSGIDKKIQAGRYHLSPAMTEVEIAQALQDPTPRKTTLTIIPGWRVEEIAAVLPDLGFEIAPQDLISEVQQRQLEGHLYPDTYHLDRAISASLLADTLSQALDDHITPDIRQGLEQRELSLQEGIILASIVEKEAVLPEEMPQIASVFLNRLNSGMYLGADPTIQYAVGYNEDQETWWTNPLSREHFDVPSPYNTYLNLGLPPGPICNPGLAAIEAVAFADPSPYYYFSAACDGSGRHHFSRTYEEHQQMICP